MKYQWARAGAWLVCMLIIPSVTSAQFSPEAEGALLARDWTRTIQLFEPEAASGDSVVARNVLSLLCHLLNRKKESEDWGREVNTPEMRATYVAWTAGFHERHPKEPVGFLLFAEATMREPGAPGAGNPKALLQDAIKIDKSFAAVHYTLGCVFESEADAEEAAKAFDKAIKLQPELEDAYFHRAAANSYLQKFDKAIKDYDHILQSDPRNLDILVKRGNAHLEREDYDAALADYEAGLQVDPTDAMTINNRGFVLLRKKDYDRAVVDFQTVIAMDISYTTKAKVYAYTNLGDLHRDRRKFEEAVAAYSGAIASDSTFSKPYVNRGCVYMEELRDTARACADFIRACELGDCHNFEVASRKGVCE